MRSSWPLLASVLLTVVITAALASALATFGARALPRAVRRQLEHSRDVSILVSGSVNAAGAAADSRAVRSTLNRALARVPYQLDEAIWSEPLGLPTRPGAKTVPDALAAAVGQVRQRTQLVSGAWPGRPLPGRPVPAALPVAAAQQLRVSPGSVLTLRNRVSRALVRIAVTGLFRPVNPTARYWGIDLVGRSGVAVQQGFTTYGPLVVSSAALGHGGLTIAQASWIALPDPAAIGAADAGSLGARLGQAVTRLETDNSLGGLQVTTGLPQLLTGIARNLFVARSLLGMGAVQLLVMAAAALALAARSLASHRDEETAMLGARGASRWQLARPTLAEALTVGAIPAALATVIGTGIAGVTLGEGLGASVAKIPGTAWWAALAVLILVTVVMLWPTLALAAPGAARVRRGRQARLAGALRAGTDLALLALAALAVWQLRDYSAVADTVNGGLGIDPVVIVAPALALVGIALIPLRLLPAIARGIDRLTATGRRLTAALASWQISRLPIRQSGPALLMVLAVATGTLALAEYQSWRVSAADQAAFSVGADVRMTTSAPVSLSTSGAIGRLPGVTASMPAATFGAGSSGEVLALDPRAAAATVALRPDLSALPVDELWHRITPRGPPAGLALPGRPARLEIIASLAPGAPSSRLGSASATVSVQDAHGVVYTLPAGTLQADGRDHDLIADLSPARTATYPLRLLGLSLTYTLPGYAGLARAVAAPPTSLVVAGVAVSRQATGPFAAAFADGSALAGWQPGATAPGLNISAPPASAAAQAAFGSPPQVASWQRLPSGDARLAFQPGHGPSAATLRSSFTAESAFDGVLTLAAPPQAKAVPAIATAAFLRANSVSVGATMPASLGPVTIPLRIVASVAAFPTITGSGGGLVIDEAAAQSVLASRSAPPLQASEWWLRTAGGSVPARLPPGFSVASSADMTASLLANPLSGAPREATLAIGAAAAVLAGIGFSLSVGASLQARRMQAALLSALGVTRSEQARQLCAEQLMLSLPAAVAGLLAGIGIAYLLVPAVTLTPDATTPVPSVSVQVPFLITAGLAAAITALPVLAAAASVLRRPDPAAQLRGGENA
jgi:hypothetical protein